MTDDRDYVLSCLRRAAENDYSWPVSPSEAKALLAEIERLRELLDVKSHEAGLYARRMEQAQRSRDDARAKERAAVATYLRGLADDYGVCIDLSLAEQAGIIERGEHCREEQKK